MKQTNKKYISKEMAMMAAITTESMLLHEKYDAMLYWSSINRQYCIIVEFVNDNPAEKYPNYSCSSLRNRTTEGMDTKSIVLNFEY